MQKTRDFLEEEHGEVERDMFTEVQKAIDRGAIASYPSGMAQCVKFVRGPDKGLLHASLERESEILTIEMKNTYGYV